MSCLWPAIIRSLDSVVLSAKQMSFVIQGNIEKLSVKQLEAYKADMWLLAPPCQPYTRRGLQKDADDWRASSFMTLLLKLPQMQVIRERIGMLKKKLLMRGKTTYCSLGNADSTSSILILHKCHPLKPVCWKQSMLGMQPARNSKHTAFSGAFFYQHHSKLSDKPCLKEAIALHAAGLLLRSMHGCAKQASGLTTAALRMLHIIGTDKALC